MIHFITASSFVQCTLFYSPSQRPFWNVSLLVSTKQSIALELIKSNTQGPGAYLHHNYAKCPCTMSTPFTWALAPCPNLRMGTCRKGGGGWVEIIKCPTLTMIGHHVQGPSVNTALIVQSQRGVYFQKNWVRMCSTLPETLTLFQTKICDFPYPISDLTLKSVP